MTGEIAPDEIVSRVVRIQARIRDAVRQTMTVQSTEELSSVVAETSGDTIYALEERGQHLGICCHPYDVCTELIARELGVTIVKPDGSPLDASLDTTTPVAWVGYANGRLRSTIEPVLTEILARSGL